MAGPTCPTVSRVMRSTHRLYQLRHVVAHQADIAVGRTIDRAERVRVQGLLLDALSPVDGPANTALTCSLRIWAIRAATVRAEGWLSVLTPCGARKLT